MDSGWGQGWGWWLDLSPSEWDAVRLSVRVSIWATLASLPLGILVAWVLARKEFWGKAVLNGVVHLPLILPPVVTGYLLLLALGRRGPVGQVLEQWFGIVVAFRWTGAAVAAGVMAFPLMVRSIRLAIEAVDRAMRGEAAPSPIYEGEDSVVAWVLDGPGAEYRVPLPAPGEPKRGILDSYTKEHSAEYQSQALIDLARRMGAKLPEGKTITDVLISTSHHTHFVIGTGSNDPQKFDPNASRETLDHSIMYIFAVALQDRAWHHVRSYAPERAARPDTVELWRRVRTEEDPEWTRRYHSTDPNVKAFGGRVTITFDDGSQLVDEIAVADAHPLGARPFGRKEYFDKFRMLADGIVEEAEQERFLGLITRLPELSAAEVGQLNVQVASAQLGEPPARGLFEAGEDA